MATVPFDQHALNTAYRYCYALTGDQTNAYDLLQDGLERYLRCRVKADNPPAMLRQILRNRFIDTLRTNHHGLYDELDALDHQPLSLGFSSLEDLVVAQDELDRIWHELQPDERELLHLWAVEGYTAQEVAHQLGQARGTVLSRIHRLRRKLEIQRVQHQTPGEETA